MMEIRLKSREAAYCNLKLFLLFLVVFGHLIEPCIWDNRRLYEIYRIIYLVHMPLFVFLSGLFLKSRKSCLVQMKKAFLWYVVCQAVFLLAVKWILRQDGTMLKPYWHLWYLLSLSTWCLLGACYYGLAEKWCVLRRPWVKILLVVFAVILGCLAGKISWIGRTLSLSRSIVFLPYFLVGMFCPVQTEWRKYRSVGLIFLLFGGFGYWLTRDMLTAAFLYQASNFGSLKNETGYFLRFVCYFLGGSGSIFLLCFTSRRRFFCTKAGANTMMMYVLHAPVVRWLWELSFLSPWYELAAPFVAFMILFVWYKAFQWHGPLFQITGRSLEGT